MAFKNTDTKKLLATGVLESLDSRGLTIAEAEEVLREAEKIIAAFLYAPIEERNKKPLSECLE